MGQIMISNILDIFFSMWHWGKWWRGVTPIFTGVTNIHAILILKEFVVCMWTCILLWYCTSFRELRGLPMSNLSCDGNNKYFYGKNRKATWIKRLMFYYPEWHFVVKNNIILSLAKSRNSSASNLLATKYQDLLWSSVSIFYILENWDI